MTDTPITRRCPVCSWAGDPDGDDLLCPECGYGTVPYEVTIE